MHIYAHVGRTSFHLSSIFLSLCIAILDSLFRKNMLISVIFFYMNQVVYPKILINIHLYRISVNLDGQICWGWGLFYIKSS